MNYKIDYKKAAIKLISAFLIVVFAVYFLTTCNMITNRTTDSVENTTWYSTDLTVFFYSDKIGVIYNGDVSEKFVYKQDNGYIFAYNTESLDLEEDALLRYEFTHLGERLYCSTNNIMFYAESVVYG